MSKYALIIIILFSFIGNAQGVIGKWKTIDDKDGKVKSIVEIYERDGEIFGKIVKIYNPVKEDALCEKCEGEDRNKPVLGFKLIRNLTKEGKYYKNGTIFDPRSGKEYNCRLKLTDDDPDVLQVRGYVSFLYATQYWQRVKE